MRRLAVLYAVLPGVVHAQPSSPPDPVEIHANAVALAKAGWEHKNPVELQAAIVEFKRAIALDDVPKYECNLALALEGLGELARAHARLSRCAPRLTAIDPTLVRPKLDKLALLEAELVKAHVPVRIEVSAGPATATITAFPDDETMVLPTTVWLAPGSYQLTVRFGGRRDPATLPIEIGAAEIGTRKLERVPTPEERPLEPAIVPDEPPAPVERPVVRPRPRRAAVMTMAAGGAAVVGGAVVHYLSRDQRAHLASLSGEEYTAFKPTWHRYQWGTIGLYGAGTVALGVGAYLFFRDRSPVAIAPAPAGDGAVVSWTMAR